MSTMSTCGGCGEAFDLALPHECNRETRLQRALKSEMTDNDRLRAALAAAEAKLVDERRQMTAALEAERLHADALADHMQSLQDCGYEFHSPDNCDRVDALLAAHAARRAAEVANGSV